MKTTFSISELAREFAVTPRAIRFYEQEGMLSPSRQGQTRIFSNRDRARLGLIVQGKRVGFSLSEIREMLDLYDIGDGQVTQLKVSRKKFADRIVALERQRIDIDESLAGLRQSIAWMDQKIKQAEELEAREKSMNVVGFGVMPRTGT
jgi:DNA-binding transcriptional MerR regulator